jgi:hypothetical protein
MNSSVQSVVAMAFRAAALGLGAVSLALAALDYESLPIITLSIGLIVLVIAGFIEPGHEAGE